MQRRHWIYVTVTMAAIWEAGCTQGDVTRPLVAAHAQPSRSVRPLAPAASDSTMGSLSLVAQNIVAALQDSSTRAAVNHAMKSPRGSLAGLDLQSCDVDATTKALFASAERRGGAAAASLCASIKARSGAVLYMAPEQLKRWTGASIPIVTARGSMDQALQKSVRGYRSPDRLIDIPLDGTMTGPVLWVIPISHPSRINSAALGSQQIKVLHSPVVPTRP
jgi:hypothetical protein